MTSSRAAARASVFFGTLAVLAIPAAVGAAHLSSSVRLLQAIYVAVPAGFVLGLIAVSASRRARLRLGRSVRRSGERTVRLGRFLAWAGLYLSVTGALALACYGVLRAYQ